MSHQLDIEFRLGENFIQLAEINCRCVIASLASPYMRRKTTLQLILPSIHHCESVLECYYQRAPERRGARNLVEIGLINFQRELINCSPLQFSKPLVAAATTVAIPS